MKIITRTYIGGKDLYHGVPNLERATVEYVTAVESKSDYVSIISLRRSNGETYKIEIRQEK